MKKEVVIKVLKGVGTVIVTGLGIRAIVGVIELKKQRDQLVKDLCKAEFDAKVYQAVNEVVLAENEILFNENVSLRNPEPTKKKA